METIKVERRGRKRLNKSNEDLIKDQKKYQDYMRDYMKDYQKNNTELMKNQRLNRNTFKEYNIDDLTKEEFKDNIHSIVKIFNIMKKLDEETIKKFIQRRKEIQIFPAKESNPMIL